ncbi:hypothetical protein QYM36_004579 [Artemia franciscana]|uniref:Fas apoptotic inhibitory molecule n=2 Tax=Artemia franciscana TaxID=6661 RepID=A0AA88I399_ARTSF|nr:hypothetical protein QYM36_004579 [Artemia franciscana]
MGKGDSYIARWNVPLPDKVYVVELEHGSISGKRVIRLDGEEIYRKDWMFRLVGTDIFYIGENECAINIDSIKGLKFRYTLTMNGKPLEAFTDIQNKVLKTWCPSDDTVVVLDTQKIEIYVNGNAVEMESEFTEEGSEMRFFLTKGREATIKIVQDDKELQYYLKIDKQIIPPIITSD